MKRVCFGTLLVVVLSFAMGSQRAASISRDVWRIENKIGLALPVDQSTEVASPASSADHPTRQLGATIYYLALEQDYAGGSSAAFLRPDGTTIQKVSASFLEAAEIEGSAKLQDGRVINLAGTYSGTLRWAETDAPFGLSSEGCPLVPLRSIAVDPAVISIPSKVFIPETVGLLLPDGSTHDGVWFAVDTGPEIVGDRVDLFAGAGVSALNSLYRSGLGHLQELTVTVLTALAACPQP
jgi:3D (Asp-Asp-Asp) domain-containing protein